MKFKTLSDEKLEVQGLHSGVLGLYPEDKIKEFIELVKEEIKNGHNYISLHDAIFFKEEIIEKLAGENFK